MGRMRIGALVAGGAAAFACTMALAATPDGALRHVKTQEHVWLSNGSGAAVSPDGKNYYGTGYASDSIVAFKRNKNTGDFTAIDSEDGDGLGSPESVVVSPDGKQVYVTGHVSNTLHAYSRSSNGALSYLDSITDDVSGVEGLAGAYGLAITPDGDHLYAVGADDDAVALVSRLPDGKLDWDDAFINGSEGIHDMDNPRGVAVSPDGRNVYVAAYSGASVLTFKRFPDTGQLDFVEDDFVASPSSDVVVSPNGKFVYVASNDGVHTYRRNKNTGALSEIGSTDTVAQARAIAVAPAGDTVYVAASNGVETLTVRKNGTVKPVDFDANSDLTGADGVAVTSDGRHVAVVGGGVGDGALAAYSRQPALKIKGKSKQSGSKLAVKVSCTASCKVTLSGKGLKKVSKQLKPGKAKKVRVRFKGTPPTSGKVVVKGRAKAGNRQAKSKLTIRLK